LLNEVDYLRHADVCLLYHKLVELLVGCRLLGSLELGLMLEEIDGLLNDYVDALNVPLVDYE